MMYGTRKELNSKLKRMFGNDERFALLIWTKQDVMSLTQAMTEVEADAILREIGRKGMGEHTGDGISDSTVQALYAGLRTEIPTVSVPADLLARVTNIAGRALDTEDAQAWPLVCQEGTVANSRW
ncbi:DUF1380 family protein [Salmonella enterica]|uniref:DUF1380 family protein n=2 Tax=Salmonella enterica TaxID=28901 RepID=UPI002E188942|nr:DUF1380 family protein [Salmonella enterica subsp. enterica serovar Typhimurium]MED5204829.1 DUF1380 family protein [Salmonella enterica subsp. enterica serovar Typhimurium]